MKQYILAIFILGIMNTLCAEQDFRAKLLNWQKSLTVSQKKSIQDFLDEYERAYKAKNIDLLQHFEAALNNIMQHWDSLYKPLADAKNFHASVHDFIKSNSTNKTVKQYMTAYTKFDEMPTDQKRHAKLLELQQKLKTLIQKS